MSENHKSFNPCVIETELAVIILLLLVFLLKDCEFDFCNNLNENNNSKKDNKDNTSCKDNKSTKAW